MMLERKPYRKWNASAFGGKKLTLLVIIAAGFSRANPYISYGWAQKTRLGKSGIFARLRATGRIFRAGRIASDVPIIGITPGVAMEIRHLRQEIGHMLAAVIHFFSSGKEIPFFLNALESFLWKWKRCHPRQLRRRPLHQTCLLYTSDAADE